MRVAVADILELIETKRLKELKEALNELLPADVAELIGEVEEPSAKVLIFRLLKKDMALAVFSLLEPEQAKILLNLFSQKEVAEILNQLPPDDRTELFEELPAGLVNRLLRLLKPEERQIANELLNYPPDTAGRIMTPEFVDLLPGMTAAEAIERIRRIGPQKETIYNCYVVTGGRQLVGHVSLKDLLLAPPNARVGDLMEQEVVAVNTHDDQESVAKIMEKYDLLAVPVVDSENRLVGIITVDDILDIIEEESTEDAYRFGAAGEPVEHYTAASVQTMAIRRMPWLIFLGFMGFFSDGVMRHFGETLAKFTSLAFYIPLLCDSGGNAGTQAATVVIRSMALGEVKFADVWRVVWKEVVIGLVLGIVVGVVGFIRAIIRDRDPLLGSVVGMALIGGLTTGTTLGGLLPLIFSKLGIDPAVVSGPLITTIVDIASLGIYFGIATIVLLR